MELKNKENNKNDSLKDVIDTFEKATQEKQKSGDIKGNSLKVKIIKSFENKVLKRSIQLLKNNEITLLKVGTTWEKIDNYSKKHIDFKEEYFITKEEYNQQQKQKGL